MYQAHPILVTLVKNSWNLSDNLNLRVAYATKRQAQVLRKVYHTCAHPVGGYYTIDVFIGTDRYIFDLLPNNSVRFSVFPQ